jgi:hypothetical protein
MQIFSTVARTTRKLTGLVWAIQSLPSPGRSGSTIVSLVFLSPYILAIYVGEISDYQSSTDEYSSLME